MKFEAHFIAVIMVLALIGSGCSSAVFKSERRMLTPDELSQKMAHLRPGDTVRITTKNNEDFELEITTVAESFLEGYAFYPGQPGAEWWPTRHNFKDMKILDGNLLPQDVVSGEAVAVPSLVAAAEVDSPASGSPGDMDEQEADQTSEAPSSFGHIPDLRNFYVGSIVEIIPVAGETVRMKVDETSEGQIRGTVNWQDDSFAVQKAFNREDIADIQFAETRASRGGVTAEKVVKAVFMGIGVVILAFFYVVGAFAAGMAGVGYM